MELFWKKFNGMGTEIIISAFLDPSQKYIIEKAEKIIIDFEKRFSRFIKDNELYKLNNFQGRKFEPSEMMLDLLKESQIFYFKTDGLFDPTVISSLEAIGYDKNFADTDGKNKNIDLKKIKDDFFGRVRFENLKIIGDRIFFKKGFRIDFGGIGKGYIVDFLAKNIFQDIRCFWISAGGDLFVKGNDAGKNGWEVGVQDPLEENKKILTIKTNGESFGIATSGIPKRKGVSGDFKWHHIIDPRTALPAENDILTVTVISSTARRADIFAKTVLILGEKEGLKFIEREKDSACGIILRDKSFLFSKRASKYF